MAILYPDYECVLKSKVKPEEGELYLLDFLRKYLDDSFEIYFQPFLNGDRPDIIIMRKSYGVMIIEVKDWKFQHYRIDNDRNWHLKQNDAVIKSPVEQASKYKQNIFNLHIEHLFEKKIKNSRFFGIVSCAIYFHNETHDTINDFMINPFSENTGYISTLKKSVDLLGRDDLDKKTFDEMLKRHYLISGRPSQLFDDELYKSFRYYLHPPMHSKEDGKELRYIAQQKKLIESEPREQIIKGVAGSGKTTILAARAVNAHLRHNEKVLILTFNITLKNYIHDKISKVREDFSWNNFHINNYHNFLASELNNLGVKITLPDESNNWDNARKSEYKEEHYFSNIGLFRQYKDKLHKYKTILIDEIQDYRRPWMDIIKECYLEPGGEYVLFGDEKQNIYGNELDNMDIRTNIRQRPAVLKDTFRIENRKIADIALSFQNKYFSGKYAIDEIRTRQIQMDFSASAMIDYTFIPESEKTDKIFEKVAGTAHLLSEHPNDVTVLGFSTGMLRHFDCIYRTKTNERTNCMFESQEVYYKLLLDKFVKSDIMCQGMGLIKEKLNDDRKNVLLAVGVTRKMLSDEFNADQAICRRYSEFLERNEIDKQKFNEWFDKKELKEILNKPETGIFQEDLNKLRNNRKYNFWYNSGTIKISTIHSFKGWEANTLFLIIEPDLSHNEFHPTINELIYTGLTRSRTNLIVINYGNKAYHADLQKIIS